MNDDYPFTSENDGEDENIILEGDTIGEWE